MIGFEVGGVERAVEVQVYATGACIIGAGVNKVEAFAGGRSHALLFIVCSGAELLMWSNGRDDGAWAMWLLSLLEMCFGGWCGD